MAAAALLFSQATTQASVRSAASGTVGAPVFGATLWNHDGTTYPLIGIAWDPASTTGLAAPPGAEVVGTDALIPGTTAAQISPEGIGIVIDSASLVRAARTSFGPLPFILAWNPASPIRPFVPQMAGALVVSLDLTVPLAVDRGAVVNLSSSQIVLYVELLDTSTGHDLAFGLDLFNSRGANDYPSAFVDNGVGGTNASVLTTPAGGTSAYSIALAGASAEQGAAFTDGHFVFEITPDTLAAAIGAVNRIGSNLSTSPADYAIRNVSLDAEIEYGGASSTLGFSVKNLTVSTAAPPQVAVPSVKALPRFLISDLTTGATAWADGVALTGNSYGLEAAYTAKGNDAVAITAGVSNAMIVGGTGQSLLRSIGGTNVLVAGSSDSWLTGCMQGQGTDTFEAFIRPAQSSWVGVSNFHSGEWALLADFLPQTSAWAWTDVSKYVGRPMMELDVSDASGAHTSLNFDGLSASDMGSIATLVIDRGGAEFLQVLHY